MNTLEALVHSIALINVAENLEIFTILNTTNANCAQHAKDALTAIRNARKSLDLAVHAEAKTIALNAPSKTPPPEAT